MRIEVTTLTKLKSLAATKVAIPPVQALRTPWYRNLLLELCFHTPKNSAVLPLSNKREIPIYRSRTVHQKQEKERVKQQEVITGENHLGTSHSFKMVKPRWPPSFQSKTLPKRLERWSAVWARQIACVICARTSIPSSKNIHKASHPYHLKLTLCTRCKRSLMSKPPILTSWKSETKSSRKQISSYSRKTKDLSKIFP